jgi:hypothetical protein
MHDYVLPVVVAPASWHLDDSGAPDDASPIARGEHMINWPVETQQEAVVD